MARYQWTDEKLEKLEMMVERKLSATEIAKQFGVSRARIYQVMEEHGIETPKRRREQKGLSQAEYRIWKNLIAIKSRAEEPVDLELEDLLPLPTECPILGIPIDYKAKRNGCYSENSPSIDRINPKGRYTKDNVVVCSWRANRIKNDGTAEEHKKIFEFMYDYS